MEVAQQPSTVTDCLYLSATACVLQVKLCVLSIRGSILQHICPPSQQILFLTFFVMSLSTGTTPTLVRCRRSVTRTWTPTWRNNHGCTWMSSTPWVPSVRFTPTWANTQRRYVTLQLPRIDHMLQTTEKWPRPNPKSLPARDLFLCPKPFETANSPACLLHELWTQWAGAANGWFKKKKKRGHVSTPPCGLNGGTQRFVSDSWVKDSSSSSVPVAPQSMFFCCWRSPLTCRWPLPCGFTPTLHLCYNGWNYYKYLPGSKPLPVIIKTFKYKYNTDNNLFFSLEYCRTF